MQNINFKPTCRGTPTVPKYEGIVQRDGSVKLAKAGVRYLDEEIQADKDAGDINVIVRRYAAGDTNVLNAVQGYYGDLSDFPKTRHEMLQAVMNAESAFYDLPDDLRDTFDNDWRKAFVAMDSGKFEEIIKSYTPKVDSEEKENKE